MRFSNTKLTLFLTLVVCLMVSKSLAHHHDKDCNHDKEDNNDQDDNNDWDNENISGNNNNGQDWGNNNNNENNGQSDWSSGTTSSTYGRTNTWLGSEWPVPTNSNGEVQSSVYYPPGSVPTGGSSSSHGYPSGRTPNVVTVTLTQVITETSFPTGVKSEPLVGSMASTKSAGVPVVLAAILFAMMILA
ncbi:hypothetical protein INT48_002826 [Thamnidium elegans]|uniref:Uncharacterized protein n=1 Tax=Thamnidium elegans TaxID=101142 RepID=A0A8H7SL41_9FUNG|nr:hypothetical protein INT48_002826 [Thamnidium elegans]